MKKIIGFLILGCFTFISAKTQHYLSISDLNQYSAADVQTNLTNLGIDISNMDLNAVNIYKMLYKTIDINGDTTVASGAVCIPQIDDCNSFPLVSYHHGTVFNKLGVPSNGSSDVFGLLFAGNGYIVAMPDYLGLGDNPGFHPYLHWETEATSSIDLIRAIREYLSGHTNIKLNGQVFLTGYSQGGHVTMAVHKYITENNLLTEFNVTASAPLSGTYNLSGAQADLIINNDFTYDGVLFMVYIIEAYQDVYNNLYSSYNEMYDSPYDSLVHEYFDGDHWGNDIDNILSNDLYSVLQDSVLNNMLLDTTRKEHPLYIDLRYNNVHSWIPVNPVRMLYCGLDSIVSPQNAISARDTMIALGASDVSTININPDLGHDDCWLESYQYVFDWFDSIRTNCQFTQYGEMTLKDAVIIYPNPVKDFVIIKTETDYDYVKVINILGSEVICKQLNSYDQNKLNVSNLKRGVYFIMLYHHDEIIFKRKLLKE